MFNKLCLVFLAIVAFVVTAFRKGKRDQKLEDRARDYSNLVNNVNIKQNAENKLKNTSYAAKSNSLRDKGSDNTSK